MTLPSALPRVYRLSLAALAACSALAGLSACAPLLVGGAVVGGSLVVTDRRTAGVQVEDQSIEFKAASRIRELATLGHVNATSYNRVVLLTGEVPTAGDRERVQHAMTQVENVRSVVNELAVRPNSGVGSRSSDAVLGAKVKATLVDARDLQANAFKVVAERGEIYLMGRVSEGEAQRAAELVRSVSGVQKVVRVLEILSDEEAAALRRGPSSATAPRQQTPVAQVVPAAEPAPAAAPASAPQ